jgi:putative GTP pyrophosphokinase
MELKKQKDFLATYNISDQEFEKTQISWAVLKNIFDDYLTYKKSLDSPAILIFNELAKAPKVHLIRYRIKDPEHLIEKIIRKRIDEPERIIDVSNYKSEITDLIGIRAIHLYKNDWEVVDEFIKEKWDLKDTPTANHRKGDSDEQLEVYKTKGCLLKEHKFGYRSVHYILQTRPDKNEYFAEIQLRTIFEEGWSEIDHNIRYPYDLNNRLLAEFLLIFNRLSGNADEMGSFIKFLQSEVKRFENENSIKINAIKKLEAEIDKLKIAQKDKESMKTNINKLGLPSIGYPIYNNPFKETIINAAKMAEIRKLLEEQIKKNKESKKD